MSMYPVRAIPAMLNLSPSPFSATARLAVLFILTPTCLSLPSLCCMDASDKVRAPAKRSKWDADDGDGQVDELERQAVEARAKAAAKAARQRAKAAQRARRDEEGQRRRAASPSGVGVASSSVGPSVRSGSAGPSTPLRGPASTRSSVGADRRRIVAPPVPPRSWHPSIYGCRSIHNYERLNHIEEGSYGVVFRGREKTTGEIVALKKLKMDKEKNGFPITSLREIRSLMEASHENVVRVREIVVGDTLTQ